MTDQSTMRLDELLNDPTAILSALRTGVAESLRRHKLLGEYIVVSDENGDVLRIAPEDIPSDWGIVTDSERRKMAGEKLARELNQLSSAAAAAGVESVHELLELQNVACAPDSLTDEVPARLAV